MKKLFLIFFANGLFAAMPSDPLINWDIDRRLPLSSQPTVYFRDEYYWYFNNQQINTHVYNAQGVPQYQYDEPIGDSSIDIERAWDIQKESTNILVATIDYGFDLTHEDLTNNVYVNPIFIDEFGTTNLDMTDHTGHGTMILSVIAGNGNNNIGGCGVLWRAKILPIKHSTRSTKFAQAINYAVSQGARVINISDKTDASLETKEAIERAALSNCIIVCSAINANINQDTTEDYPTSWHEPNVLTVSSSKRDETLDIAAYGSNSVALFAPGRLIIAAWPENQYRYTTGTSFATAMVSGSLALILEKYPDEPYQKTVNRLLYNVDKFPVYNASISGGRLNVYKSLIELKLSINKDNLIISGAVGQHAQLKYSTNLIQWNNFIDLVLTNDIIDLPISLNNNQEFFKIEQIRP